MIDLRNISTHLEELVVNAVRDAIASGDLPDVAVPAGVIERPKDPANGDFASTISLRLARAAMKPPLAIASAIAKHVAADPTIEAPTVASPGFINIRLATPFVQRQVEHIIAAGQGFADLPLGGGRRAQIE